MILLIDNYDSFLYNLARYVGILGRERTVARNDEITLDAIRSMQPEAVILSPGPCTPDDAGICKDVIEAFGPSTPILGVCLGHQCIGEVYGGRTVRAEEPVHGRTSEIHHDGSRLFDGLNSPFQAARYHSLVCDLAGTEDLEITAQTKDDVVMAVQHKTHPVYGIQFHPESVLTEGGMTIMRNFLTIADDWNTINAESRRNGENKNPDLRNSA